jgi:hypothetical protein
MASAVRNSFIRVCAGPSTDPGVRRSAEAGDDRLVSARSGKLEGRRAVVIASRGIRARREQPIDRRD